MRRHYQARAEKTVFQRLFCTKDHLSTKKHIIFWFSSKAHTTIKSQVILSSLDFNRSLHLFAPLSVTYISSWWKGTLPSTTSTTCQETLWRRLNQRQYETLLKAITQNSSPHRSTNTKNSSLPTWISLGCIRRPFLMTTTTQPHNSDVAPGINAATRQLQACCSLPCPHHHRRIRLLLLLLLLQDHPSALYLLWIYHRRCVILILLKH